MSKDNQPANLRLLGSPVNLSYRGKKKSDKKNLRNRPHSALQNSCFSSEHQEKNRRPFSADTKARAPSSSSFLKAFSLELLHCNNPPKPVKVVPPTTDILGDTKTQSEIPRKDKDICSNASDYGSEDTYISLGTKIKAKAQLAPKVKNQPTKNHSKYRNIAKKGKKMDNDLNDVKIEGTDYDMEVKIIEKGQLGDMPYEGNMELYDQMNLSTFRTHSYDSYFLADEAERQNNGRSPTGHVKLASITDEVERAIDTYSRRLTLTKQQLSLVEEESTQDFSSLSPENSIANIHNQTTALQNEDKNTTNQNIYFKQERNMTDEGDYKNMSQNFLINKATFEPRSYKSFYDDFRTTNMEPFKSGLSSTMIHTDSSSKDSGYVDVGPKEDKIYKREFSLPNTMTVFKKEKSDIDDNGEPKSLDSISLTGTVNQPHLSTDPPDRKRCEWTEPINHSRLLYKDFFLKQENIGPVPPQNSPNKINIENTAVIKEEDTKKENNDTTALEYPPYLLNSSSKAYTSKVIEDYKKEIQAINNLHELTLKDIKSDAISPTPLNIDKMFEQDSGDFDSYHDSQENSASNEKQLNTVQFDNDEIVGQSTNNESDVSKISTKQLIQNYLKVKDADYNKDYSPKDVKKFERKFNSISSDDINSNKHLNNSMSRNRNGKSALPIHIKNQTLKNVFSVKAPLSARIDSVHIDKDVDSWISLTAPSPRIPEIKSVEKQDCDKVKPITNNTPISPRIAIDTTESKGEAKVKELHNNSSVLDIYSMLKDIESFGENPVKVVRETPEPQPTRDDEISSTPKDNFMEIFEFLEKVEHSANEALSIVTNTTPQSVPKLESLLRLPQTELAQRLITASLQLEERSCCIALLQESLSNHKQQMVAKISSLEKQSIRSVSKVKQECEEAIRRHQSFIDQLISDKKTLNHRIEQLVDERRMLEERWKRSAQTLEERYKLELKNQHDKMTASQQVARQRWVRQKAEKIKELTVKGLEGELREMADRQQKELADVKMYHAEHVGRLQARHANDMEELRRRMQEEKESALTKERQLASSRLEKQILELELTYQEQRTRLVAEMRAENERVATGLSEKERNARLEIEKWKEEQEKLIEERRAQVDEEIAKEREKLEQQIKEKRDHLEEELQHHKQHYEAEQQMLSKKREKEIAAQHKQVRDREIEKAIESMETEAQTGRKELQEAMRRNKEQYETELKELAETEQATLKRYQEAQARVRQTEDRCAELEVTVSQLETRNRLLAEKNNQLEQLSEQVRSSCEETWRSTVDGLRKEIEEGKTTHEEQMHQLYAKVKVAVARKDSAIQALTREAGKAQEKITLLEQKLQQQRKDFLKHK